MPETQQSYDDVRNLATHRVNLQYRLDTKGKPEGACELCAAVTCLFNVTPKRVLVALEKDTKKDLTGDHVKQFYCRDIEDDPSLEGKVLRFTW